MIKIEPKEYERMPKDYERITFINTVFAYVF